MLFSLELNIEFILTSKISQTIKKRTIRTASTISEEVKHQKSFQMEYGSNREPLPPPRRVSEAAHNGALSQNTDLHGWVR